VPGSTIDVLLVTPPIAAKMLAISERSLWSLTAPRGPIPALKLGASVRYDVDDLKTWIKENKTAAAPMPAADPQ
jgi:hypothetical protein